MGKEVSGANHIIQRSLNGKMPGYPNMYIPIVDVRDVANAHIAAITALGGRGYPPAPSRNLLDTPSHCSPPSSGSSLPILASSNESPTRKRAACSVYSRALQRKRSSPPPKV